MQNPFMSAAFKPDLAFTGAAERFFELLKSFSLPGAGAAGAAPDWSPLAGSLAGQFEQWLKSSQPAGSWFTAASAPGSGAGFGAAAAFGPLPLGAGAAPQQDAQRSWDLVARLAQLQAQLASYWSEIAHDAAQRFVTRMGAAAGGAPTLAGAAGAFVPELTLRVADTLARLRQARDVTVGCSAKRAVWSFGKTTLYEYLPLREAARDAPQRSAARPLLICFALVNRPYVLDLQPDRSLVRRLLAAGLSVYLIDWGDPDDADRCLDLEDYVEHHLGGCVRHILVSRGTSSLDLLGVCQGGVLSLCYTALHRRDVANLVTLTTPVDFHTPDNLLSKWVRELDTELLRQSGNVPGEALNGLFLALMPFRLTQQKYVRLLAGNSDQRGLEDFVRMERWLFDSPPQAAVALAEFVRWFYQENRLIRGTLRIGGKRVDLAAIVQPVLNLYALGDHIVPPGASAAMERCLGSRDYTGCGIDTGHIGMYASRKGADEIPSRIISWLRERP